MNNLNEQLNRAKELMGILNEQKAGEFEGKPIPSPTTPEGKELLKKALHSFVELIDNKEGSPGGFNIFLCNSAVGDSAKEAEVKKLLANDEELKKFPPKLIHMYLCSARDVSKGNWKNGEYQWDHLDAKFPEFFGTEEIKEGGKDLPKRVDELDNDIFNGDDAGDGQYRSDRDRHRRNPYSAKARFRAGLGNSL